jgi:hypothetical protein
MSGSGIADAVVEAEIVLDIVVDTRGLLVVAGELSNNNLHKYMLIYVNIC